MIQNVIFDLGGVLIDLDFERTLQAFPQQNLPRSPLLSSTSQHPAITAFERGQIDAEEFQQALLEDLNIKLTSTQFEAIWNAMLVSLPPTRIRYLLALKQQGIQTFLLSNTNVLHYQRVKDICKKETGYEFESLFTGVVCSYQLGLRKPEPAIYQHILSNFSLDPRRSLFIDDLEANVKTADNLGFHTWHLNPPGSLEAVWPSLKQQFSIN